MNWGVWERFSTANTLRKRVVANPEQIDGLRVAIARMVTMHVQANGAKGNKRKAALKEVRVCLEQRAPVLALVAAAYKVGVPMEDMTAVAVMFS